MAKEDRLSYMYELQRELQAEAYGKDPTELEGDERLQFAKDMHIALTDELHEALGEIGWKPWATSKHFEEDAYKAELVDAWHFFMNLMLVARMTPEDLFQGYTKKRQRNIERQLEGYDGVSTKCPYCKRALDDPAVKCEPEYKYCDLTRKSYNR